MSALPPADLARAALAERLKNASALAARASSVPRPGLHGPSVLLPAQFDDDDDGPQRPAAQRPTTAAAPPRARPSPATNAIALAKARLVAAQGAHGNADKQAQANANRLRPSAPPLVSPQWQAAGRTPADPPRPTPSSATASAARPVSASAPSLPASVVPTAPPVPSAPADARVDASTGIRLHGRPVSEAALRQQLAGVTVLGFDRIDPARPPAQWATYGVLYSKGEVKLTSFGKPYMTVRVFDMDRRLANVTLLDGAVDAVLTVRTGTAIVIGAAEVTKRDSHVPGYQRPPPDFKPVTWGLTISFPGQIMVLGTASDFSQCTGNVSGRDGVHRCSVWLNNKDRRHLLCLEHSKRELQHATSSRGQFRYDVQKTVAATGYRIPTGMMSAAPSPAAVVNATVAAAAAAATADTPAVSSAEPARRLDLEMQLDPFGDIDSGGALRGVSVSDLVERESAARRRAQASKAIDQLFGSDEESDAEPDAALARVKLEPAVAGAGARAGAGTEGSSLTTSLSAGARADARRAHSRVERDEKLSQLPPAAPTVFDKHIAAAECKADADPGAGSKLGRGTAKAQQAAALASFDVTAAVTAALGPSRPPAPVAIKTAPTESTSASAPAPAVGVGAGVNASLMRGRGAQCVQRAVTLELAARLNVPGQPPTASVSAASAAAAAAAGVGAGSLYRRASGGATVATLHSVATVQKAGADNATLRGFVTSPGYDAGTGALNGSSITEAPGLRPQPPHGQPSAVEAQQQLRVRAEAEAAADAAAVRARASAAAAELARESAELEQQQAELERMQRDVEEQRRKVQAKLRAQQQAQQQQSLVPQVSAAVAAMAAAEAPRVPAPRPVQPPTTATAGAGAGAAGAGVVAGDVSSASLARARSLYGPSAAARASAAVQLSGSPAAYAAPSALPQTPGTGVTTGLLTGVTGRPAPAPAPAVAPVNAALQRAKDQLAVLAAVKQEAGAVAASPATGATARPTDLMAPAVYVPGSGGSAAAARVSSGTNTGASSAAANAAARNQLSRALFGEAASKDSRFLSVRANSSTSQAQAMVAAAAAPWAGVAPVRAPSSAAADAALLANAVTDATLAPASAHVSGLAQFAAVQRQATGQIKRPVPGAATVDAADDATASANGGGCETEPAEAAEERARLIELYGYDPSARFAEQAAQGLALNKEVVATEKRRRLDEQLDRAARAEQLDEKLQEKKQQNTVLFKCSEPACEVPKKWTPFKVKYCVSHGHRLLKKQTTMGWFRCSVCFISCAKFGPGLPSRHCDCAHGPLWEHVSEVEAKQASEDRRRRAGPLAGPGSGLTLRLDDALGFVRPDAGADEDEHAAWGASFEADD